jgi:hypothetical protein
MAWYWNEYIYIGIWILVIFFGLGAAVYTILTSNEEEGFMDASFDVATFLNAYKVKDICDVFAKVYEAEVNAERANGTNQRPEAEARERANKNLATKIPGGPLQCPPTFLISEDLRANRDAFKALPDTTLITIYGTLLYSIVNLQMTYNKIVKTMVEANKAKAEGFQDICTKEEAEEKRKAQCKLPEEVTPEERAKIEAQYKEEITTKKKQLIAALGKWMGDYKSQTRKQREDKGKEYQKAVVERDLIRKQNKDKGEDVSDGDKQKQEQAEEAAMVLEESVSYLAYTEGYMTLSMDDMIKKSKDLIQKIDVLKKKLEAGDTTLPQESFMDYFVSPLH